MITTYMIYFYTVPWTLYASSMVSPHALCLLTRTKKTDTKWIAGEARLWSIIILYFNECLYLSVFGSLIIYIYIYIGGMIILRRTLRYTL